MSLSEDQMMQEMRLIPEDLDGIDTNVKILHDIYTDFVANKNNMQDIAEHFARVLNYCPEINSVKWRVKDPSGLIKKIIRKKKEVDGNPKYKNIDVNNYKNIVTDLVGLRAIFLFKEHWSIVDDYIFDNLNVCSDNPITIYHANDDDLSIFDEPSLSKKREELNYTYKLEQKTSRYKSIHYILREQKPSGCKIELQTRSILDEAWAEIDHFVRYPHNMDNTELVRKMSVLNGQISACEELASHSYKYFSSIEFSATQKIVNDLLENNVKDTKNELPYEDFKRVVRTIKIGESAIPLRNFEGVNDSNSNIAKALESLRLNLKTLNPDLELGINSANNNIAKALESLRLNFKTLNPDLELGINSTNNNIAKALKNLKPTPDLELGINSANNNIAKALKSLKPTPDLELGINSANNNIAKALKNLKPTPDLELGINSANNNIAKALKSLKPTPDLELGINSANNNIAKALKNLKPTPDLENKKDDN